MLVWIVCGLLTLAGALVCAELASAFPQTGGADDREVGAIALAVVVAFTVPASSSATGPAPASPRG